MRNHAEFVRVSPGTGNGERRSDLLCVNLRGSFAAQYAQGIEHQRFHFVFARIDEDRGEEQCSRITSFTGSLYATPPVSRMAST